MIKFTFFVAATTLTSWHLMVTYCTLHVAHRLNLFESKPIDTKTVVLFGMLNGISIGFLNLSLGFNSVGFYQVDFNYEFFFWILLFFSTKLIYYVFLSFWFNFVWFLVCFSLQMTKLAIIPFTVMLETIFLKKQFRY